MLKKDALKGKKISIIGAGVSGRALAELAATVVKAPSCRIRLLFQVY